MSFGWNRKSAGTVFPASLALTAAFVLLNLLKQHVPSHRLLFACFFLYTVMLPGYLASLRLCPWAKGVLRSLAALVLGTMIAYVVLFIAAIFRLDIRVLGFAAPLVVVVLAFRAGSSGDRAAQDDAGRADIPRESPAAAAILVGLIVAVSLIVLVGGDPFTYTSDSAAHVAYVRTVSRTHEAFPEQFYYRNGGMLTHDLRQGMGQALWGAVNALTGNDDIVAVWPLMSLTSSAFILVALFSACLVMFGSACLGIAAAALFVLFYAGGLRGYHLAASATGYAYGQVLYVSALAFIAKSIEDGRRGYLVFAAVSAVAATMSHVAHFGAVIFIGAIFTLSYVAGARGGVRADRLSRGLRVLAVIVLGSLPYLILRYVRDYAPNNPLHTQLQGALFVAGRWYVLSPILYAEVAGPLGLLSAVAIFILWKRSRHDMNLRLLLNGTIAVYALMFVPLWYPFLFKTMSYLILKFEFAVPSMIVSACLLGELWKRITRRSLELGALAAGIGIVATAALLGIPLVKGCTQFAYRGRVLRGVENASYRDLDDLWTAIGTSCRPGASVASDPITSFGVPAFTDEYAICPYDQHATPNDSTAIARIVDCRRIYSPVASMADIRGVLDKYGAEYLVVNGRIPPGIATMYWKPDAGSAVSLIDRLREPTSPFRIEYEREGIVLARLAVCPTCREVEIAPVHPLFYGDSLDARGAASLAASGFPGIGIERAAPAPDEAARGDTITMNITWVAERRRPFSSYVAYLRFDTGFPKNGVYRAAFGKPYRKAVELLSRRRYRFRFDFQPLGGLFPPDSWPPMREIRDRVRVAIPRDLAPGSYTISLKMAEKPQYPNYVLKDIFTDADVYGGVAVGSITIR
jgi:hypothetical protein